MGTGLGHGGGKGGETRLDGLLGLLDTGTNASVRRMAATQIGELIAAHPAESRPVLRKVRRLLFSPSWDTRVAAGHAIAAVAAQTPRFIPAGCASIPAVKQEPSAPNGTIVCDVVKKQENGVSASPTTSGSVAPSLSMPKTEDGLDTGFRGGVAEPSPESISGASEETWLGSLRFADLDIERVMQSGARLFGSSGNEYEGSEANIQQQRARLKADLGLDDRFTGGQDILEIADSDLVDTRNAEPGASASNTAVDDMVDDMASKNLSARERNRLKREAKKRARFSGPSVRDPEPAKRQRTGEAADERSSPAGEAHNGGSARQGGAVADAETFADGQDDYETTFDSSYCDFQPTCEVLKSALFNVRWEVRHGAAVGMRHILAVHAESVGRRSPVPAVADAENGRWLQDVACRLLCVLVMDRFGDFVGDAVVAPVRETAAMAMAAASRAMSRDSVMALLRILVSMQQCEQAKSSWEVRHAVLLGVRYILAVQADGLNGSDLITVSFNPVSDALRDADDDVRAVAAEALFPIVSSIVSCAPERVPFLVATLWDALLDLDDISASTGSVLRLLNQVSRIPANVGCSRWWLVPQSFVDIGDATEADCGKLPDGNAPEASHCDQEETPSFMQEPLLHLVPRLWSFLRHGSLNVRLATVSLLDTFLSDTEDGGNSKKWLRWICGEALERLFRNILLESNGAVLQITKRVWSSLLTSLSASEDGARLAVENAAPLLSHWLQAASHETRTDAAAFDQAKYSKGASIAARRRRSAAAARRAAKARAVHGGISGSSVFGVSAEASSTPAVEGPYEGVAMQQNVADAIGMLGSVWPLSDVRFADHLSETLRNPFATARRVACEVLRCWATHGGRPVVFTSDLQQALLLEMEGRSEVQYAEIGVIAGGFFGDTVSLLDAIAPVFGNAVDVHSILGNCHDGKRALNDRNYAKAAVLARSLHPYVQDAVATKWAFWEAHVISSKIPKRKADLVFSLRQRILTSLGYMSDRNEDLAVSLAAAASCALVVAEGIDLPQKVGPYIKALTASTRKSANPHTQEVSAKCLAQLARRLSVRGTAKPLQLLLKNLTKHLTAEPSKDKAEMNEESGAKLDCGRGADVGGRADNGGRRRGRGGISATAARAISDTNGVDTGATLDAVDIARRGASLTFCAFCQCFGDELFERLPWLWNTIKLGCEDDTRTRGERVDGLTLLRTIVGRLSPASHEFVSKLIPNIITCCASVDPVVGDLATACLADVVAAIPGPGMRDVVHRLLPLLGGAKNTAAESSTSMAARRGASKALRAVVDRLGSALIPYAAFLIVPVMMRMVDEDAVVREASSGIFGVLVRLMPLEKGAPDDPRMSAELSKERDEARVFLGQLLGTHPRTHYEMPIAIGDGVALRKYQQECLDWLAFLNRYGLHGALCDDMGLGKTLMTLCIMAGTRVQTPGPLGNGVNLGDSGASSDLLPSLVVCPSTIAAHWVQESQRFFPSALHPVVLYVGSPKARARIRRHVAFEKAALVVTSYDVLGNDLEYFSSIRWNYLALDEGHVIKNSKTRAARAVRALSPQHRLVLTGTPIQNSVLELWSLFDFLMPGFLGSEQSFKETYAKPILASRGSDCTESDQEKGLVATEALHRQVLPFVLRRLKDDVLSELPPKIMQDYYCNLTPLQVELYEDFSRDISQKGVGAVIGDSEGGDDVSDSKKNGGSHVFKVLSYLRRLCSHPKLVLSPDHPEFTRISRELSAKGKSVSDISVSAKLMGLRNILEECGIGDPDMAGRESGGHRVLIFAQLKQMLDLVVSDLFRAHMPTVTYLRLDGSVETSKRQTIVTRFNSDPTIDCLLLTTSVGGLGLNLVGADTVIFLEHDWNPTKDLQAMDRAHRMGQKRTVNVYRLITRGTLEEKIMGIQRFKTHIANTVVNRENSSLQSMNTETLLSLFKVEGDGDGEAQRESAPTKEGKGMKAALAGLGELWEEKQYEDEYNMDAFLAGIQGSVAHDSSQQK